MRKIFSFKISSLMLSSMVCIITLNSCSKISEYREAKKREERQKQEQNTKKIIEMLNEGSYRKEATLLAIKYKFEEDKVFNLLAETQGFFDLENLQVSIENKSLTKNRLNSLAEKYNIPIEILASILIDYYSMQACEH